MPAIAFGHWPDRFYHSSHDTLEKVDPAEMEKVAWVASQLAQVVANAGPSETALLARETSERDLRRLSQEANEALWALHQIPPEDRGQTLCRTAGAKARQVANLRPELSEQEREADRLVPVRHWTGLLNVLYYLPEVLGWEKTAWLIEHINRSLGVFAMLGIAALWVDGKRRLLEIARHVALGTGIKVDLDVLLHYFRDLAETGVVSLQER